MRFLGDTIEPFEPGDLVFIGSNVPHCWRNHTPALNDPEHEAEMLTVQFKRDFLGDDFYKIAETVSILEFLKSSARGIKVNGLTRQRVARLLLKFKKQEGISRILTLISILDILSQSSEIAVLASEEYIHSYSTVGHSRINKVHLYLINNFHNQIMLRDVASVANMSETAFCRYLKLKTGKTFSQFLNEIRVGYACKLLVTSDFNLSEISVECGYNNLSNFSIQFKLLMKQTPKEYQKRYKVYATDLALLPSIQHTVHQTIR